MDLRNDISDGPNASTIPGHGRLVFALALVLTFSGALCAAAVWRQSAADLAPAESRRYESPTGTIGTASIVEGVALAHGNSGAELPRGPVLGTIACLLGSFALIGHLLRASRRREIIATRLARVAARTENGVILADRQGRIEWVNGGFERITGYTLEEVRGKKPGSFLQGPGTDPETVSRIRRGLDEGRPVLEVIQNYRKDGTAVWAKLDIHPVLGPSREVESFVSVQSDISKQKQTEALLEEARDRAVAVARMQTEFLANVSHELRTPLNGILCAAELLLAGDLTETQRDLCDISQLGARDLLGTLSLLLEYSELLSGRAEWAHREYDVRGLVDEVVARHRDEADHRSLALRAVIDPIVPPSAVGDPHRLARLLSALVENAIKFTRRGRVWVTATLDGDRLQFAVADTGVGIAPELQDRLFDAFYQGDASTTRTEGGLGMGLAVAREIANHLGGSIQFETKVGVGSRFLVDVPLHAVAVTTPTAA